MARKKKGAAGAAAPSEEVAEEAPNRPSDDDEEEEVSDEALAAVEARLQARMDASARGAEDIESAPASSAPAATVSLEPTVALDPLEEDEDEPTFQSRLFTLKSIPYADDAYGSLAPHAATAWQKVTEGVAMARVHTKEYEQTVAETIAPLSAAVEGNEPLAVRLLLRKGANPNLQDGDGDRYPLHWASAFGDYDECAELLVQAGASSGAPACTKSSAHSP